MNPTCRNTLKSLLSFKLCYLGYSCLPIVSRISSCRLRFPLMCESLRNIKMNKHPRLNYCSHSSVCLALSLAGFLSPSSLCSPILSFFTCTAYIFPIFFASCHLLYVDFCSSSFSTTGLSLCPMSVYLFIMSLSEIPSVVMTMIPLK